LYRLYRAASDDHFYCATDKERNTAEFTSGYTFEGVIGYVYRE